MWYRACTEPSSQQPPIVLQSTQSSILFQWGLPFDNGSCPITTFKLYLDDGANGDFESRDEDTIADKSYLREHLVVFNSQDAGKTFRFRISAFNEIGESISAIRSQLLAESPAAPLNAPQSDSSVTNYERIKVDWDIVTQDGASEILSYSLEIDDGTGGDFVSLVGTKSDYLL